MNVMMNNGIFFFCCCLNGKRDHQKKLTFSRCVYTKIVKSNRCERKADVMD